MIPIYYYNTETKIVITDQEAGKLNFDLKLDTWALIGGEYELKLFITELLKSNASLEWQVRQLLVGKDLNG